jgi:hypothetical protein
MKKLTSQEAFELSKCLRDLSVSLGDYRIANWDHLSEKQRRSLEDAEWSLLNASSDARTVAVGLVLDETQLSYAQLLESTSGAKDTLKHLADVGKALNIATAAVLLAGAIVSRDPGAILKTAKGLYDFIK